MDELLTKLSANPSQLSVEFQWDEKINPLAWFEAQPLYPKFYWRAREGQEEVFALGEVSRFTDPLFAERRLNENQRIWGGIPFPDAIKAHLAAKTPFFFLPQIEIERQGFKWVLKLNPSENKETTRQALKKLIPSFFSFDKSCHFVTDIHFEPDYATWQNMVDKALDAISQQALQKVVLARKTHLQLANQLSPMAFLAMSQQKNPHCYHFAMVFDPTSCFLGSTPERLFRRQGQLLTTEALAGTVQRAEDVPERDEALANWLLEDDKNNAENLIVGKDILARLAPYCCEVRLESLATLVKLRQVQHLKRKISASLLSNIPHATLIECLQPTAAVAGYPRKKALQFIHGNEPFQRDWYAGSVGYLAQTKSEFCVAIRSAFIVKNKVNLYAGAGVVKGSLAKTEWQELNQKTATLQSLFEQKEKTLSDVSHSCVFDAAEVVK